MGHEPRMDKVYVFRHWPVHGAVWRGCAGLLRLHISGVDGQERKFAFVGCHAPHDDHEFRDMLIDVRLCRSWSGDAEVAI